MNLMFMTEFHGDAKLSIKVRVLASPLDWLNDNVKVKWWYTRNRETFG